MRVPTTVKDDKKLEEVFFETKKGKKNLLNGKKPKTSTRKRVLAFQEIGDKTIIAEANRQIKELKEQVEKKSPIPLSIWCAEHRVDSSVMIRLLNESNYPVIRIGTFEGAYELHLSDAFDKEAKRQIEQQVQNRVCAKILADRREKDKERPFEDYATTTNSRAIEQHLEIENKEKEICML